MIIPGKRVVHCVAAESILVYLEADSQILQPKNKNTVLSSN